LATPPSGFHYIPAPVAVKEKARAAASKGASHRRNTPYLRRHSGRLRNLLRNKFFMRFFSSRWIIHSRMHPFAPQIAK